MGGERRAILWDNDGVLVDTERWFFEANRLELAALGVMATSAQFEEINLRRRFCGGARGLSEGKAPSRRVPRGYRAGGPRREGLHRRRGLAAWDRCCPGGGIGVCVLHAPGCWSRSRCGRGVRSGGVGGGARSGVGTMASQLMRAQWGGRRKSVHEVGRVRMQEVLRGIHGSGSPLVGGMALHRFGESLPHFQGYA